MRDLLLGLLVVLARPLHALGVWLEDRTGLAGAVSRVARVRVPRRKAWEYVWGSATLTAFLVQLISGIGLALVYTPSAETAYASIRFISQEGTVMQLLRGLHYYGAGAFVVLMFAHLARVYLTGSYKFPREANWLLGVVLLLLGLLLAFTGMVLVWNRDAVWSVVVGAEQAARTPLIGTWLGRFMLGGENISGVTLTRFYAAHVLVLPGLFVTLTLLHVYLAYRNGLSERARPGEQVDPRTYRERYRELLRTRGVPYWPHAAWRDALTAAGVVAVVYALASLLGPPDPGPPADPTVVDTNPHPYWYFRGYFALLALWPYVITNPMLIIAPAVFFGALILLPLLSNRGERSINRRPWAPFVVGMLVAGYAALTYIGYREPWVPAFEVTGQLEGTLPPEVVRSDDAQVQAGARLFVEKACVYCHQIGGYGGQRGPHLDVIGTEYDVPYLKWIIANGATGMPPYGPYLSTGELNALAAFLATRTGEGSVAEGAIRELERQEEQPPAEQEAPPKEAAGQDEGTGFAVSGAQVYQVNCATCHGSQGQGGIGPALAGNDALQDTGAVVRQILRGGGGMPAFAEQLNDEQIAAVATHIRTTWGNEYGRVSVDRVQDLREQPEGD